MYTIMHNYANIFRLTFCKHGNFYNYYKQLHFLLVFFVHVVFVKLYFVS